MSIDQQHETVSAEQAEREAQLVERVVASFGATPDPRFKELMQALTRHLHAFLREVRLTEEEWQRAIEFLTAAGHITDDRRQEFILLSDVLGASMQVIAINNEAYRNATEATVFGPFFVEGSPEIQLGGDIAAGAPGEPCWVEGTVTDASGKPVMGASSRCRLFMSDVSFKGTDAERTLGHRWTGWIRFGGHRRRGWNHNRGLVLHRRVFGHILQKRCGWHEE